jgi:hypothetical protein
MSSICGSTFLRRNYFLLPLFRLIDDTYFKIAKTNKQTNKQHHLINISAPHSQHKPKQRKHKNSNHMTSPEYTLNDQSSMIAYILLFELPILEQGSWLQNLKSSKYSCLHDNLV